MQLVVFTLGRERYALPIERVQEIIRFQPQTAGVISLRGTLVPVRDIARDVGAGALAATAPMIVVVELPGGPAGVLVDGVDSVLTVAAEQLSPMPAEVATNRFGAIARIADELVFVIDPDHVLAGVHPAPAPKARRRRAAAGQSRRKRTASV